MALGRRRVPCISRQRPPPNSGWPRTCGASLMSDRMFVLGAIHILSGFTVLSLGIMSLLHRTFAHEYCVAIVGGCLLVATGVLGVLTAHLRTTCTLISFFVCTIFCVALAGIIFALSVVGIGYDFARTVNSPQTAAGPSAAARLVSPGAGSANQLPDAINGVSAYPNGNQNPETGQPGRPDTRGPESAMSVSASGPGRSASADDSWRKNALSIHCTQLAASVLALAVALVAAISCTKRVCCNPNVSFFENRVRVSLVLPQLLATPPPFSEERATAGTAAYSLLTRTDIETQTEPTNLSSGLSVNPGASGATTANRTSSQNLCHTDLDTHFVEITNHNVSNDPPVEQSRTATVGGTPNARETQTAVRAGVPTPQVVQTHPQPAPPTRRPPEQPAASRNRRLRPAPYSRSHSQTDGETTRVSLTLSSANRHVRAYYRCGMPIGPFFLNASDLPAICPPERLVGEQPAATSRSRSRSNRYRPQSTEAATPTVGSSSASEQSSVSITNQTPPASTSACVDRAPEQSRRSILPGFLRRGTRSRRREASLPDNRIVYLYTTSRSNELEGYVYPSPPPPYFVDQTEPAALAQPDAVHTALPNAELALFTRSTLTAANVDQTGSDTDAAPVTYNTNSSSTHNAPQSTVQADFRDREQPTEDRPLLRDAAVGEDPPEYSTLDRPNANRFRWLRSSARASDGEPNADGDAAETRASC